MVFLSVSDQIVPSPFSAVILHLIPGAIACYG